MLNYEKVISFYKNYEEPIGLGVATLIFYYNPYIIFALLSSTIFYKFIYNTNITYKITFESKPLVSKDEDEDEDEDDYCENGEENNDADNDDNNDADNDDNNDDNNDVKENIENIENDYNCDEVVENEVPNSPESTKTIVQDEIQNISESTKTVKDEVFESLF